LLVWGEERVLEKERPKPGQDQIHWRANLGKWQVKALIARVCEARRTERMTVRTGGPLPVNMPRKWRELAGRKKTSFGGIKD